MTVSPTTVRVVVSPGVMSDGEAGCVQTVRPVAGATATTSSAPAGLASTTNSPPAESGWVTGRRSVRCQPAGAWARAAAGARSARARSTTRTRPIRRRPGIWRNPTAPSGRCPALGRVGALPLRDTRRWRRFADSERGGNGAGTGRRRGSDAARRGGHHRRYGPGHGQDPDPATQPPAGVGRGGGGLLPRGGTRLRVRPRLFHRRQRVRRRDGEARRRVPARDPLGRVRGHGGPAGLRRVGGLPLG